MRRIGSLVTFAAGASLGIGAMAPLPAQPWRDDVDRDGGACTYFEDTNFQGRRDRLAEGENRSIGPVWNDRISSVQCDPGCGIELYEHVNFDGARERFRGDVANVGRFWNDRASSLRVSCRGSGEARSDRRDWRDDDREDWGRGRFQGGFLRQGNRQEVLFQYTPSGYCHVQNPAQMNAYGGFGQVRVVPVADPSGRFTGPCPWPNGFYRRSNEQAVYRLFGRGPDGIGGRACHVVDPAQMARFGGFGRVTVVEPRSELFVDRERPGPCRNP